MDESNAGNDDPVDGRRLPPSHSPAIERVSDIIDPRAVHVGGIVHVHLASERGLPTGNVDHISCGNNFRADLFGDVHQNAILSTVAPLKV